MEIKKFHIPELIPLKEEFLKEYKVFGHTINTLRYYYAHNKHPEWFAKIGGKVFLDVRAYFESAVRKTDAKEV